MVDTIASGTAQSTNPSASSVRSTVVEPDAAALERREKAQVQTDRASANVGAPAVPFNAVVQDVYAGRSVAPLNASQTAGGEGSSSKDPISRLVDTISKGARELDLQPAAIINTLAEGTLETGQALVRAIETGNQEDANRLISANNAKPTREYGSLIDLRV